MSLFSFSDIAKPSLLDGQFLIHVYFFAFDSLVSLLWLIRRRLLNVKTFRYSFFFSTASTALYNKKDNTELIDVNDNSNDKLNNKRLKIHESAKAILLDNDFEMINLIFKMTSGKQTVALGQTKEIDPGA